MKVFLYYIIWNCRTTLRIQYIKANEYKGGNGMCSKAPVVFVPGLLGSIGDEILPGSGELKFGPAGIVYNDFIDALESMGYKKGENLAICYYNWTKGCRYNVDKYLLKTIQEIRKKTGSDKVDIIAHSMGGLVARSYIKSNTYKNDVRKLILLGCPNTGATDAYYVWAEGKMPDRTGIKSFFLNIVLEGFVMVLKHIHKSESIMDLIHKEMDGIEELLPSRAFGRYLYYLDKDDIMRYFLYEQLKYKNAFLDDLNSNYEIYRRKGIECYIVAGTGKVTGKSLQLADVVMGESDKIDSGKISGKIRSFEGDGTVLEASALEMTGIKYVIEATHAGILLNSLHIIRKTLLNDFSVDKQEKKEEKRFVGAIVLGRGKVLLNFKNRDFLLKSHFQMKDLYCFQCNTIHWILVDKNFSKDIHLSFKASEVGEIELILSKEEKMEHRIYKANDGNDFKIPIS